MFDVINLGQVFTPNSVVDLMLGLRKNFGRVLEPSSGNGAFSSRLDNCVSIEIDPRHANESTLQVDFFDYDQDEKFETIIGNPPYVRYQDISSTTKMKLNSQIFDSRSNLYLFFMEKCLEHLSPKGELIFIVPRDFLKSTSSIQLNRYLFSLGTITHLIDLGDSRVFLGAVPNCVIFRFEKGNFDRNTRYLSLNMNSSDNVCLADLKWQERKFQQVSGQLVFSSSDSKLQMIEIAEIKVGAVSGLDAIYASEELGNRDFVFSETARTGKTRKMIWAQSLDQVPSHLFAHKEELIARKIRKFDESNWWEWGRGYPLNEKPRVYVNCKTRSKNPFFKHDCNNFDGSVLAIFPRKQVDLSQFVTDLNSIPWEELGFYCDGRYIFSQRSLENAPLPDFMSKYL
jgi:adenine-specific DNA-methyltransferase